MIGLLDQLMTALNFAFRQKAAFTAALDMLKQILTAKIPFTKIGAAFLAVAELFSAAFLDTPRTPRGDALDLTGYELVFEDEFDGDALNTDVWRIVSGYAEQVSFRDGNMVLTGEYKSDGSHGKGLYAVDIGMNQLYCKGYYEIRCKVFNNTSRRDFWSAFWITGEGVYDPEVSKGGVGGCEIDIYESFADTVEGKSTPVGITPAIWCNGVDDDEAIDGINFGQWKANDPVNEYNTYGVMWTDDYYIWYINGVECFRINYGSGPSQVPEQVRISMCTPSTGIENLTRGIDQPGDYIIDYVRIYQPAA